MTTRTLNDPDIAGSDVSNDGRAMGIQKGECR